MTACCLANCTSASTRFSSLCTGSSSCQVTTTAPARSATFSQAFLGKRLNYNSLTVKKSSIEKNKIKRNTGGSGNSGIPAGGVGVAGHHHRVSPPELQAGQHRVHPGRGVTNKDDILVIAAHLNRQTRLISKPSTESLSTQSARAATLASYRGLTVWRYQRSGWRSSSPSNRVLSALVQPSQPGSNTKTSTVFNG